MNGRSATKFVVVRFGNVLNSAGSVIPLLRNRLQRGAVKVTIRRRPATHEYTWAAQLVMQAGAMGKVVRSMLDMGSLSHNRPRHGYVRLMGLKWGRILILSSRPKAGREDP